MKNLQWFIDRIGKRIYRKPLSCKCKECQRNYVDISDGIIKGEQVFGRELHANYIFDCQGYLRIDYFDKEKDIK